MMSVLASSKMASYLQKVRASNYSHAETERQLGGARRAALWGAGSHRPPGTLVSPCEQTSRVRGWPISHDRLTAASEHGASGSVAFE